MLLFRLFLTHAYCLAYLSLYLQLIKPLGFIQIKTNILFGEKTDCHTNLQRRVVVLCSLSILLVKGGHCVGDWIDTTLAFLSFLLLRFPLSTCWFCEHNRKVGEENRK